MNQVMKKDSRIYVAGHRGLVGGAIVRRLRSGGYSDIVTRTHAELDLTRQSEVERFFDHVRPEYIFLAAARVGGIGANSEYPGDFLYQNTLIAFNVIETARKTGVRKLLNLGSSCIYPKFAPQPLKEEYLLSGELEPTNEAYAIAKIAAIKQCSAYNRQYGTDFLSLMPTNLYGPGDNYDPQGSHVLPALIRKFHEAKSTGQNEVTLWGDGSPRREFLYSEDLADAAVYLMERFGAKDIGEFVNVGTGKDLPITELAEIVRDVVYSDTSGRGCAILWDSSKPNGTPRKVLDCSRMAGLGWNPAIRLADGLRLTYDDFLHSDAAGLNGPLKRQGG